MFREIDEYSFYIDKQQKLDIKNRPNTRMDYYIGLNCIGYIHNNVATILPLNKGNNKIKSLVLIFK